MHVYFWLYHELHCLDDISEGYNEDISESCNDGIVRGCNEGTSDGLDKRIVDGIIKRRRWKNMCFCWINRW